MSGTIAPDAGKGDRCIIVASGPSAADFVPPQGVPVMAVNGAIDVVPRAEYFFTLDPSGANLLRLLRPRPGVCYAAAGCPRFIPRVWHHTRINRWGKEPVQTGSPVWWLWHEGAVLGLSENADQIHSGNSAYGALGFAYHLGFKNVALVGVDATDEPRIGGGHSGNLSHLPILFASALPQINLVSCGKLNSVPQMPLAEWLART